MGIADREKAIRILEGKYKNSVLRHNGELLTANELIALLKAHEPVEPKIMEFVDEGMTWEKYEVPTCGVCGALLGDALFCPMCGRAVKRE